MKKKIAILFTLVLILAACFAVSAQAACSHSSTKLVVGKSATCCSVGYKNRVCTSCGTVVKAAYSTIAATGKHTAVNTKVASSPTCTKAGQINVYCKASGKLVTTSTIKSLGHSTKSTVTLAPTCISRGKVSIACTRCSFRTSTSIPIAPNEHASLLPDANGVSIGSAFSCTAATCTSAKCITESWPCCGLKIVTYEGNPAAHKYTISSSMDSKGNIAAEKICNKCGAYEKTYTPAAHTSSHRCSLTSSTSLNGPTTTMTSCNQCGYYKKTYTPYIYTAKDSYSEYTSIVK